MTLKKILLGAVALLIGLPVVAIAGMLVALHLANETNGELVSSGEEREYLLYVAKGLDRAKPAPLVVSLHGAGGWPAQQAEVSGWNALADEHGFIVVYPAGLELFPRIWRVGPGDDLKRDIAFVAELIDKLQAEHLIDPARIYVSGLSNGGGMAFALSCALPERFAAVGMVGAAHLMDWTTCPDAGPMPMISFHGTDDPIVPFKGGASAIAPRPFPDVRDWTAGWARRNRCAAAPVETTVAPDVTLVDYPGCAEGAPAQLYVVNGGGHTWPGHDTLPDWVGPVTLSIDATRLSWAFFSEHPRRPAVAAPAPP